MLRTYSWLAAVLALLLYPLVTRAQSWQWAAGQTIVASTTGYANVNAVATDGRGRVVVAGDFRGTVQFGAVQLAAAGGANDADAFVAWLDAAGNWLGAARAGGASSADYARQVAIDPAGNALVLGSFQSYSADFGAFTLTNASQTYNAADIFAARCSPQGTWVQAQSLPGDFPDQVTSNIVFDAQGNALFAGFFNSNTLQVGSFRLTRTANLTPFLARLSPQGTWLQATPAGAAREVSASIARICLDAAGNVVVGGSFQGPTFTFGSTVLTNADPAPTNAGSDLFVARLDAQNNWVSALRAGAMTSEHIHGLDFAPNGDLVVAGLFSGTTTVIGSTTLANANPNASNAPLGGTTADIFVARLSPQGSWSQVQAAGGPGHETLAAMQLDTGGNAIFAGSYRSAALPFGSTTLANNSSVYPHAYVARLGAGGQWTHAVAGGTGAYSAAYALALDSNGTVTIGGFVGANLQVAFGPHVISGGYQGQGSGMVARLQGLPLRSKPPTGPALLALSPNPAHTSVHLQWEARATAVQVFDALGREVRRQAVLPPATSATLPVQGLAPGFYTVRCGAAVGRLVVE